MATFTKEVKIFTPSNLLSESNFLALALDFQRYYQHYCAELLHQINDPFLTKSRP
jgi:hypothetical protein